MLGSFYKGRRLREAPAHGQARLDENQKGGPMLRWALAFFIVALIAAVFGFFGIATAAAGIAKLLFFVFLVLFLISLVGGLVRRA